MHTPETWGHFKQCPLARDDVHLATWKPEDRITQQAGWGPATPPANKIRRLMQKPELYYGGRCNWRSTESPQLATHRHEACGRTAATPYPAIHTGSAARPARPTDLLQPDHTLQIGAAYRLTRHRGTTGDPDRRHALHHVAHCDTRAHGMRAPKPADPCSLSTLSSGCPQERPPNQGEGGEPCAVCYELGSLGHDHGCGGTETRDWFSSQCVVKLHHVPSGGSSTSATPQGKPKTKTSGLPQSGCWPPRISVPRPDHIGGGDSPDVEWLETLEILTPPPARPPSDRCAGRYRQVKTPCPMTRCHGAAYPSPSSCQAPGNEVK